MSLTNILITELANLKNVYRYQLQKDYPNKKIYNFKTESNIDYTVGFYQTKDNEWVTGFDKISMSQDKDINARKVFNTVFKITDEFYQENENEVDLILFHADQKKERIYKYYTNKLFPNTQIEKEDKEPNGFVIKFN